MRRATTQGFLAIGLMVIAAGAFLGPAVAGGGATVEVRGHGSFEANEAVTLDYHFSRDRVNARQGETITWVNRGDLPEFHTVTIVDPGDLPASLDDVFACGEPGTICADLFNHGTEENPIFEVEAPGSRPGLDARGDSRLIAPGGSNSATVSAQPGTTLATCASSIRGCRPRSGSRTTDRQSSEHVGRSQSDAEHHGRAVTVSK